MDTTLVTVTVLSMGMAAALSVIVWRLLREERRRSEARVAALSAAVDVAPAVAPPVADKAMPFPDEKAQRETRPNPRRAPVLAAFRKQSWVTDAAADLPLRLSGAAPSPVSLQAPLFVEATHTPAWGNRLAVMAALALLATTIVLTGMTINKSRAVAAARAPLASARASEPGLELMSLRDSHEDGTLTITGLVHNPRGTTALNRVTVTAYTFDENGAFLASGRALLDVTSLAPGDDSPFVVTVRVSDTVARYRIGFRSEDGRVIGHVDRRPQGPVAELSANPASTHWQ